MSTGCLRRSVPERPMIAVATPEWDPLVTPKEPRSFDWAATVSVVKGENKFDVDLKGR